MLAPINHPVVAVGSSSPACHRSTALGADAFQAHPIGRSRVAAGGKQRRFFMRLHKCTPAAHLIPAGKCNRFGSMPDCHAPSVASLPQRATTPGAAHNRVGGLFQLCDNAGGDCVKPFHARNPAPDYVVNRVFA
jgi:hypothetical protein